LIHQPRYNLLDRWIETDLLPVLDEEGIGCIVFSPLAQGLLTDNYLRGIPQGSRASKPHSFLQPHQVTEQKMAIAAGLNAIALSRGQTLAQMALAWVLRRPEICSALIGASRVAQVDDAVRSLTNPTFSADELQRIDALCAGD
jgi:L-glyceraldehyde 3-phosphate reductase